MAALTLVVGCTGSESNDDRAASEASTSTTQFFDATGERIDNADRSSAEVAHLIGQSSNDAVEWALGQGWAVAVHDAGTGFDDRGPGEGLVILLIGADSIVVDAFYR